MKEFDSVAIGLIQKLCDRTDCKVVVSSTWRHDFEDYEIEKALEIPVIGHTPIGNFHFDNPRHVRGNEIDMWFNYNKHLDIPKYAIVDDIRQFLPHQEPYFVQTDEECGLSLRNYLDLKQILS